MTAFLKNNRWGLAFLLAGLMAMALGIFRGEVAIVFHKAVRVCLECVGIG